MASNSDSFSKAENKQLKLLVEKAWTKELNSNLMFLSESFDSWSKAKLSPFDLVEEIHMFHNRTARELFKKYTGPTDSVTVGRAIAENHLDENELSEGLKAKLQADITYFKKRIAEG
jgi:hypothetical protein